MKWVILIVIVVLAAGGGYYYWSTRGDALKTAAIETVPTKVVRGSVVQSVQSTGRVVSNLDVDIKCKASGEIIELPFDVSDRIRKDDLLVAIDPIDEERAVKRADVALSASKAKLEQAKINLSVAEKNLATARDRVAAALKNSQTRAADAKSKADRRRELMEKNLTTPEEYESALTTLAQAQADLRSVEIQQQELDAQAQQIEGRRQDVVLAQGDVTTDEIALSDTKQRLADTVVKAPMDATVSARNVQKGQIIASGITNVAGGTTVMTLSDLSHIYILAAVDESDIGKIRDPKRYANGAGATGAATRPGKWRGAGDGAARPERGGAEDGSASRPASRPTGEGRRGPMGGGMGASGRSAGDFEGEAPATTQPVHVTVDAYPGVKFEGQVVRVATRGVNVSNVVTFEVKIEVTSDNKRMLKPEMTANVQIVSAQRDDVLIVPAQALARKDKAVVVNILKDPAAAPAAGTEEREVKVGMADGANVEVVSGLSEGETVMVRKGDAGGRWRGDAGAARMGQQMMMGGGGRPR